MRTVIPLKNKLQTSGQMHRLINAYARDLDNIQVRLNGRVSSLSNLSMGEFFDFVRKIPYKKDVAPIEVVKRPYYIYQDYISGEGSDCKKKAIMISSYLVLNGIPYRLIGSSSRPDKRVHHVFPQAYIKGQWINMDATYPQYKIGQSKKLTKMEVI